MPERSGNSTFVGFQFQLCYPNDVAGALEDAAVWIRRNLLKDRPKYESYALGLAFDEGQERMELRICIDGEVVDEWDKDGVEG